MGKVCDIRQGFARPVQACAQQGGGFLPFCRMIHQGRGIGQRMFRIVDAPMHTVLPKPMQCFRGQGGQAMQFCIGLIITRKPGKRDALVPAQGGDFINAIGPVAPPTQQSTDHQLGAADHLFQIQIDGIVMPQMQQVGTAQAGRRWVFLLAAGLSGSETGDFCVSGAENDNIRRVLIQIDSFGPVINSPRCGGQ